MPPLDGHDHEEHAKRIAEIAWENGEYCATKEARAGIIKIAAQAIMGRSEHPQHPENYKFKMSKKLYRKLIEEHDKGDDFLRRIGVRIRELADRL